MRRQPSSASASPAGQATLTLHGPIGELAAALDHEQATSTVTYTATVEPHARGPAPGGMTAMLANRFVAQLTPAAVGVVELLCRNAPELTYEALQAEVRARLGISRAQLGGVLTSLAAARKRLPFDVDSPIERDSELRRYRIEPVGAELLWVRSTALAAPGCSPTPPDSAGNGHADPAEAPLRTALSSGCSQAGALTKLRHVPLVTCGKATPRLGGRASVAPSEPAAQRPG